VVGAFTGIVTGVANAGTTLAVAARNVLAVTANGAADISIFNIFNWMSPVLLAVIDTPGSAQGIAISGNYVAVADGGSGLVVIRFTRNSAASTVDGN
jgi:hypothetical protein